MFGFRKFNPVFVSRRENDMMLWVCGLFSRNVRDLLELARQWGLGRQGRFTGDFPYSFVGTVRVEICFNMHLRKYL